MAVYVDDAKIPFRRMKMSHLFADTPEELFAMVDTIDVQRKWYQNKRLPHFDICISKRRLAIHAGAVPIKYGSRKFLRIMRRIKKQGVKNPDIRVRYCAYALAHTLRPTFISVEKAAKSLVSVMAKLSKDMQCQRLNTNLNRMRKKRIKT